MAKNTGAAGSRKGTVKARTQLRNPRTGGFVKRDETPGSAHKGEFMDVKEDGQRFKGVAEEKDKRRSTAAKRSPGSAIAKQAARGKKPSRAPSASARKAATVRPGGSRSPAKKTSVRRKSDALSLLMADHKQVRGLFRAYKRLMKAEADEAERKQLADQICDSLSVHAQVEEDVFYPAARGAGVERDLMDEATVEHASAKDLIAQIRPMVASEKNFDAKVSVLGEYVDHELTKSDNVVIRLARKAIDALLPDKHGR